MIKQDEHLIKGVVIAVRGTVVDLRFSAQNLPRINEVIFVYDFKQQKIVLQVVEHYDPDVCRCVALTSTYGLRRNAIAYASGKPLHMPAGDAVLGRILNALGEPIDKKGKIHSDLSIQIRKAKESTGKETCVSYDSDAGLKYEILETGIKIIDMLFPLVKGSKTGVLGGAGCGKTIIILEIIHSIIKRSYGTAVFSGIGERIREGNELYHDLNNASLLDRSVLVFGQMNEVPAARFESAHAGAAIAESFLDRGDDVLFFADNVFRFAQAGAELSALLGRIPSETGYQPTLTSEVSEFHERIRSQGSASVTAIEAVYVPADDTTDPAVVSIFAHLDSIIVLSRDYVQQGLYPAIDPLESTSGMLDPVVVGEDHFETAQEVLRFFQKYKELHRIVAIVGKEELSQNERLIYERAKKLQFYFTQPFLVAQDYTGRKGAYVPFKQTIEDCKKILDGRYDHIDDEKFYMIGSLGDIV